MTWRALDGQARGAVGMVECSRWLPLKWLAMGTCGEMVVVVEQRKVMCRSSHR